jgi:hypothetical protein
MWQFLTPASIGCGIVTPGNIITDQIGNKSLQQGCQIESKSNCNPLSN